MSLETTITADVKKVEAEFDKLVDKIRFLFGDHPNVDVAVSHINEAKDAATIPTPTTQTPNSP
jgi:hypothetical protein